MNIPEHFSSQGIIERAIDLLSHSYAPYSKFRVSSIIKAHAHTQLFCGCNVENASFGATICAERSAITNMITVCGHVAIEWVLVMCEADEPVPPCGMCLQVLAEFGADTLPVYLANRAGKLHSAPLKDMLPKAFRTF